MTVHGQLAGSQPADQTPAKKPPVGAQNEKETKPAPLNAEERRVILEGGTERAFTGKYWNHFEKGAYGCRQCGKLLYISGDKFESHCGWPSFDDEIPGAVRRLPDADGMRTEIRCAKCDGHLGHVFLGERLTEKNTRHCVNSISLQFIPKEKVNVETAYLAGGCFWGVEHHLEQLDGVLFAQSGYMGGKMDRPSYNDVSTGRTGHAEVVQVVFDPKATSFEKVAKRFFEVHDPTQRNRQGPDIGTQYRSVVFHTSEEQRKTTEKLIGQLKANGYDVVTQVVPAMEFWPAEDYHQDYIRRHPERTCHAPVARFDKSPSGAGH